MSIKRSVPLNNLGAARKKAGYTQEQVSSITDIPLGTLRRWEQMQNDPDIAAVIKLASLYGTTTDTLLCSKFAQPIEELIPASNGSLFTDVPHVGSIAAGTPIEMMEIEDTQPVPTKVMEKHPDAFLLTVEGHSMDRILPDGCYALIDPCDDIEHDGQPYAICVNGYNATIKRVKKLANGFELAPDSTDPTYKPKIYDYGEEGTEQITVIGRVVYHVIPFDWTY